MDFSEKIINKIKEKDIKPRPHWQFVLRNIAIWVLGGLTLLIGGLAASVVIYMIKENDWEIYKQINDSLLSFTILTMPYWWLVVLLLFIAVADYYLKHTKRGYRYRLSAVAMVSVVVSVILGALFFNMGAGEAIDDVLSERFPRFAQTTNPRLHIWCHPEAGRLSGVVVNVENERKFQIQDPRSLTWVIMSEGAHLHHGIKIERGATLRMIGQQNGNAVFMAEKIMPFGPGRAFFRNFIRAMEREEEILRRQFP